MLLLALSPASFIVGYIVIAIENSDRVIFVIALAISTNLIFLDLGFRLALAAGLVELW